MTYTAAEIISQYFIGQGVFNAVETNTVWSLFIQHLPSGKGIQESAAIANTSGKSDGRLMKGDIIEHPFVQLRVRGRQWTPTLEKITMADTVLNAVFNTEVNMGNGDVYILRNVSRTSSILPMLEPDSRLHIFSANYLVTLKRK